MKDVEDLRDVHMGAGQVSELPLEAIQQILAFYTKAELINTIFVSRS